jgi:hypothetical protein
MKKATITEILAFWQQSKNCGYNPEIAAKIPQLFQQFPNCISNRKIVATI